ncbi:hypothetical protein CPB85DRAFT_1271185 [Mucidula mucida]|nr:hypothetical protein CPB85DRAFT_1271185 [Mucidula mucida]
MSTRELFAGAITAVAPVNLIDASEIRQVPDTQEVFLYPDSSASIIVEILERVDPVDYQAAAKFHFDSLAHDNSAARSEITSVDLIPNDRGDRTPSVIVLSGTQRVQKFNRSSLDEVLILMAIYRVTEKNTDIVVTFNIPTESEDGGALDAQGVQIIRSHFDKFSQSLQIINFDLFA